jgi:DNA modification methylase
MELKSKEINIVDIDSVIVNPRNANLHSEKQLEMLAKIIKHSGFRQPLIVSNRSKFLICGHGRLAAAKILGMKEIPVMFQDFDSEASEFQAMIADNKIAELAEHDELKMIEGIKDLKLDEMDFELLGLEDFEIPGIEVIGETDPDEVPEAPVVPVTKRGDVWLLGNHRLMCGDSILLDDIEKLTPVKNIDMIYTDPPYGMNAVSKSGVLSKNYKTDIIGDSSNQSAKDCFNLAISLYPNSAHVWWGANYYSSGLPDSECWLVWDKNNGGSDQTDCELAWTNFRSVVRQFTQASEKINRVHPTQKPVSLCEWSIEKSKKEVKSMIDFFSGSGSSLMACEKNNIKFYGMELDPIFCDVIINRWQNFTGKEATLESSGKKYSELKAND